MRELIYPKESYDLVGLAMGVHRELGAGFLEPVYQEAFEIVLKEKGVPYKRECRLPIFFHGRELGKEYFADFVCFDAIIVEFKAVSALLHIHEMQVMNYLKATRYKLGLLFNFGQESLVCRRILNSSIHEKAEGEGFSESFNANGTN